MASAELSPEGLFEAARHLVPTGRGRPRKPRLRRAISTAYYAAFVASTSEASVHHPSAAAKNAVHRLVSHTSARGACKVLLTDAQARYLGKRAKAAQTTPSAVLQALLSRVLREAVVGAHEPGPSARAGFGSLAEHYPAIIDSLGESDPQLRLDEPPESPAVENTKPVERPPGDTAGSSEPLDLTEEEMRQAFEEFERDYHTISQQLFGDDSTFSGHLPDRHFYAFAVTVPSGAESGGEPVTVAELLDRLPPSDDIEPAQSTHIAHLAVAADDPLDGPAIIYPQARRGTRHQSADE